jgi:hypothetical protein
MDKKKENRWGWLPAHMPGVAKLLVEKKRELGVDHVNTCWANGVVQGQPGWFFAREGALAVGVPWPAIADVAGWQVTPGQAMVWLKAPEAAHGTH